GQKLICSPGNRRRLLSGLWFVRPQRYHPNREGHQVGRALDDSKCRVETSAHKQPESQRKYACADIDSKPQNYSFNCLANRDAVIPGQEKNCYQPNSLGYSQISFQVGSIRSYVPVRQKKCLNCDGQENRAKCHEHSPS